MNRYIYCNDCKELKKEIEFKYDYFKKKYNKYCDECLNKKNTTKMNKLKLWLIKNWFMLINYLVIFTSYSIIYGVEGVVIAETLLGLWIFASVAYGAYKLFIKK